MKANAENEEETIKESGKFLLINLDDGNEKFFDISNGKQENLLLKNGSYILKNMDDCNERIFRVILNTMEDGKEETVFKLRDKKVFLRKDGDKYTREVLEIPNYNWGFKEDFEKRKEKEGNLRSWYAKLVQRREDRK